MKDVIKRFFPQNFNDSLALILIILISILWILQGSAKMSFPTEVNGGLLVTFTLVVQYYFSSRQMERVNNEMA